MNAIFLKIAGLLYQVPSLIRLADNFDPFLTGSSEEGDVTSTVCFDDIEIGEKTICHKGLTIDPTKELYIYKLKDGRYYVTINVVNSEKVFELLATPNWDKVTFSKNLMTEHFPASVVDIFMMLTFIYSAAHHHTVLLHASCIKYGEDAVAFIGESGAGKSTHSRLWLNNIPGTVLLNDDQPAVRILENGKARIYGTPWSGKTNCYIQNDGNLRGIAKMKQAPSNQLIPLNPIELFQELLSSCSMIKSDPDTFRLITATIAKMASIIPGCILENRPEKNAVTILYNYMFKTRKN